MSLALAVSAPFAMAAPCTSTSGLGDLTPPDSAALGRSFTATGSYADCYTFSLASGANAFGGVIEFDNSFLRDIDVTGISLYMGGVSGGNTTGSLFGTDTSPAAFAFGPLSAGSWTLLVASSVTGFNFGGFTVGYTGNVGTERASAVPEPGTLALIGIGLLGAAAARRRSKRAQ